MSPWGTAGRVPVGLFVEKPDLASRLTAIETEARSLGLHKTIEIAGTFKRGGAFRVRGYAGADAFGRKVHAVRVATERGVSLAVGPLDPGDVDRSQATELVPALAPGPDPAKPLEGAAFRTGDDLVGDGQPSIVLRSESGALAIWHLEPLGAAPYPIVIEVPPTSGADVDHDGRIDLVGKEPVQPDDVIAPELDDVATFASGRFSNATDAVRAHHAKKLDAIEVAQAKTETRTDEQRLRAVIERAWHAILAGRPGEPASRALTRERPPARLRLEFERWQRRIERLATSPAAAR